MNIILSGLPGSGKTTIGKLLAESLEIEFLDTDEQIEKEAGMPCRELFRKRGEIFFRSAEKEIIHRLDKGPSRVISLGGGVLADGENVTHLKKVGKLILLKGRWDLCYERAVIKGIPAYLLAGKDPKEAYRKLAAAREPIYESAADYTLEIGELAPGQILRNLLELINIHAEKERLQRFIKGPVHQHR